MVSASAPSCTGLRPNGASRGVRPVSMFLMGICSSFVALKLAQDQDRALGLLVIERVELEALIWVDRHPRAGHVFRESRDGGAEVDHCVAGVRDLVLVDRGEQVVLGGGGEGREELVDERVIAPVDAGPAARR